MAIYEVARGYIRCDSCMTIIAGIEYPARYETLLSRSRVKCVTCQPFPEPTPPSLRDPDEPPVESCAHEDAWFGCDGVYHCDGCGLSFPPEADDERT